MANTTKLTIVIDADGTAAVKVFEKGEKQVKSFAANVKKNYLAISAAAAAAGIAISKAIDFAQLSDQYDQNRRSFNSMVTAMGRDAEEEFARIQEASGNLIDKNALTEAANRALSLGIPIERLGELMEVSRAKARDMGITSTQAFNDIATGIGRGSVMILDNLGLTIKIAQANANYAANIGKTVEQLTDFEKKQALVQSVIDAGTEAIERQDLTIRTNAERWQAWRAQIENAKVTIGDFINRVAIGLTGVLQWISAGLLVVAAGFGKVWDAGVIAFKAVSAFALDLAAAVTSVTASLAGLTDMMGITEGAEAALRLESEAMSEAALQLQRELAKDLDALEDSSAAFDAAGETAAAAAENFALMTASSRELEAAQNALAKQPPPAETVAEDENLEKRLEMIREMQNRVALIGLEADEQALLQMDQKHAEEIRKLDELGLLKAERAQVELLQEQERQGLITEIHEAELQKRLELQEKAAEAEKGLRQSVVQNAIGLLSVLGQKSKAAAIAGIALSKGLEIARAIQAGATASVLAYSSQLIPGDPSSIGRALAAAARTKALTAANVALIAATGLAQAGNVGGGGTGGGIGGGATVADVAPPALPDRAEAAGPQILVHVHNQGSIVAEQDFTRNLTDSLNTIFADGLPRNTLK